MVEQTVHRKGENWKILKIVLIKEQFFKNYVPSTSSEVANNVIKMMAK